MKLIQVYDPAMCCSTGVCGAEVDPVLPRFAGLLAQLGGAGVKVERYNLAQQPIAYVQNGAVKALLDRDGVAALPAIFIDGQLVLNGAYPNVEQRSEWIARARSANSS
jgi:arsenite methyltransferase